MTSFGIMSAPMQVDYHGVLRVWREADTIPAIETPYPAQVAQWVADELIPS